MQTITIKDTTGNNESINVNTDEAAHAIRSWFPQAPDEVTDNLNQLEDALSARYPMTDELESALGISIEFHQN